MKLIPFLKLMVEKGGSDLFFSVGAKPIVKIEGKSVPIGKEPISHSLMNELAYCILDDEKKKVFDEKLELNTAFEEAGIGRFRASLYHQRGEAAMVIRHIKNIIPSFESLGIPSVAGDYVMSNNGLVLVVGATGSGKSTTMASMIDFRNSNATGHILTVEDPIEFVHEHKKSIVDQREVGIDTLSYHEALKNALRESPDVIVIGEIRDMETMEHALHFSETGHLCIATLHATNCAQTIERIINLFPEDGRDRLLMDLSLQLRAIICQRLIPGINGKRVAAIEIMPRTSHIADLILKNRIPDLKDAIHNGLDSSLINFDKAIYDLWLNNKIDAKNALHFADSPNEIRMKIQLAKPGTFGSIDPEELKIQD